MKMSNESLTTAQRTLKRKTIDGILADNRVTSHGLKILERWAQNETFTLQRLGRDWDKLMKVLLEQQSWEHPSSAEIIERQLRTGLTHHEIQELGAPDLSCRHAIWRLEVNAN